MAQSGENRSRMKPMKLSNQTTEQVINHLRNLLDKDLRYNIVVNPIMAEPTGVHFTVRKIIKEKKYASKKRIKLRTEQRNMSKKQRKLSNTKKRIRPKIRTVKKGRTVNLKGQTY